MGERWEERSRCRGAEFPDLWFPDGFQEREDKAQAQVAAAECARCPVQVACLKAALREELGHSAQYRYGVRAGLTPSERVALQAELDRRRGVAA